MELLSGKQSATFLNMSYTAFMKLVKDGRISYYQILDKGYSFKKSDLVSYVESKKAHTAPGHGIQVVRCTRGCSIDVTPEIGKLYMRVCGKLDCQDIIWPEEMVEASGHKWGEVISVNIIRVSD
jgi:hypothetical protein